MSEISGGIQGGATGVASITGGTATGLTALGLRSTGAAFDLRLATSEVLTAARTLSFNVGDADRTLTILASGTVAMTDRPNTFVQDVSVSGASLILSSNQARAAWGTNGIRLRGVAGVLTDTTSAGTVARAYTNVLGGNTIAANNGTTFTNYVTSYYNSPVAGTNVVFTQRWGVGTDRLLVDGSGSASQSVLALTGTPFTGGTATTTKPLFNIEPTGATSTGWATAGTMLGVNAASGFAGNLVDLQTNGVRMFNVTGAGVVNIGAVNSSGINFSGATLTAASAGSTTNRPSVFMTAGLGSSIMTSTAGISANDGFIVAAQGQAANTNLFGGFASNTAFTFHIRPTAKDFFGGYTGAGNVLALAGGAAASASTGGAGGNLTITGGAAAGSGNNNGGDVVITGGAKTGSGTVGLVRISSLPTTNPGPGILWNNAGTPAIGT